MRERTSQLESANRELEAFSYSVSHDLRSPLRAELHLETVNLSQLAQDIVADLAHGAPDRSVTVTIAPDITVTGDAALLRIVLQNLLGNAWKYTQHAATPRIELGIKPHDGATRVFVRKNGAGFDKRYAATLFTPFQRLHAAGAFDGTGIGLATVARIVHRQGGDIWAQSEVDRGATFYFTLETSSHNTP